MKTSQKTAPNWSLGKLSLLPAQRAGTSPRGTQGHEAPERGGRAAAQRWELLGVGCIGRYLQFPPTPGGFWIFSPLSRGQQEKPHFASPSKSYFNNRSMWERPVSTKNPQAGAPVKGAHLAPGACWEPAPEGTPSPAEPGPDRTPGPSSRTAFAGGTGSTGPGVSAPRCLNSHVSSNTARLLLSPCLRSGSPLARPARHSWEQQVPRCRPPPGAAQHQGPCFWGHHLGHQPRCHSVTS